MGRRIDRVKGRERKEIIRLWTGPDNLTAGEIAKKLHRDRRTVNAVLRAASDSGKSPGDLSKWKREKHWEDLGRAAGVLAENLQIVRLKYGTKRGKLVNPMYEIDGNVVDGGEARMDAEAEGICGDIRPSVVPLQKINRHLASGLALHLGIPFKNWGELTADDIDDELMGKLEDAQLRRNFEGTCEICSGWSR